MELLPTPSARDWKSGQASEATLNKNSRPLNEYIENFPTPNVADALGGTGNQGRDGGENLRTVVGGRLNPDWVEWLQGWPIHWTQLDPLTELVTHDLSIEPNIPRTSTEKRNRVARLKALGNGWVPACAVKAWELLTG